MKRNPTSNRVKMRLLEDTKFRATVARIMRIRLYANLKRIRRSAKQLYKVMKDRNNTENQKPSV